MTIDEAIEILLFYEQELMIHLPTDSRVAVQLGIEALKRVRLNRGLGIPVRWIALPGETGE